MPGPTGFTGAMRFYLAILTTLLCARSAMGGLPAPAETVPLWPEGAPGAIENSEYTEELNKGDENWPMQRLARIKDPRIDVYLPSPETATGGAVVICPGGGYGIVAHEHEGVDVAKWFNARGIVAFVLKYRLPSAKIMEDPSIGPLQDVQAAIRLVRRRAEDWKVDSQRIAVMGFSAGGHLAGSAATLYDEDVYPVLDAISARPDLAILVYPVASMQAEITHGGSVKNLLGAEPSQAQRDRFSAELQVDAHTPPTFLLHSADDGTVPVENSLRMATALKAHGVSFELHVFPHGGHGYGLAPGRTDGLERWPDLLATWLKGQGW